MKDLSETDALLNSVNRMKQNNYTKLNEHLNGNGVSSSSMIKDDDNQVIDVDDSIVIINNDQNEIQNQTRNITEEELYEEQEEEGLTSVSTRIVLDDKTAFSIFVLKVLKKFIGIVCALVAGMFGAGLTVSVKILTIHGFHPFMLSLVKYQVSTIFGPPIIACIWCCSRRRTVFEHIWPLTNSESIKNVFLILLRTTLGVMQTILQYYSLRYLNVADSCVIIMMTSITTVFLAKLFLNEPLGLIPVIVGIISTCGIVIMTKPPFITGNETFDDKMLTGVGLAFLSMLMASLIIILVRYMRKLHFCVFVTMYGYMATAEVLILIAIQNGLGKVMKFPNEPKYWLIMAGCALLSFCGQSLNIISLQYERASHVSLIRTCDIIFTFGLQYMFLGVKPDINSGLGALILILGTFLIGLRRWIMSLPTNHSYRKKFRFLLK